MEEPSCLVFLTATEQVQN